MLRQAQRIAALSDCLFEVTVASAVMAAGLLTDLGRTATSSGRWRYLRLREDGSDAFSERPLWIDLGGIVDPFVGRIWQGGGTVMFAAFTCMVAVALTNLARLPGPACAPLLSRFGAQVVWEGAEAGF